MKFRKRPVVVDAMQFTGSSTSKALVLQWMRTGKEGTSEIHTRDITTLEINTLEGVMTAKPSDWIIKGVEGEFYPCDVAIFEKTYEAVSEEVHSVAVGNTRAFLLADSLATNDE